MKKLLSLLVVFSVTSQLSALDPVNDPSLAVVRIKSHGASGTIVATAQNKSWILSCAHMFFDKSERIDPEKINRKITIDGPNQPYAQPKLAPARVLAADAEYDLSLIEIENGPYNYIPIAPAGFRPGRYLQSAGYDNMAWPITVKSASILITNHGWTYTQERPWHGRSGGGLVDVQSRVLIGVVNGYEVTGQQRGIYAGHEHIIKFMARFQMPQTPIAQAPQPRYEFNPFIGIKCLPGGS